MGKLFQMLQILSKKEFQAFSRYIHSPFFCQHDDTIRLFDLLAPDFPEFPHTAHAHFQAQFAPDPLPRSRFNVLKNYLLNHLHQFLIQTQLQAQPVLQKSLLVDHLRQRNQLKEAQKHLDQARELLADHTPLDASNFPDRVKIEELQLDLALSREMRSASAPIRDLMQALNEMDLGMRLKYLLPTWTLHRLYDQPFPESEWQEIQPRLEAPATPVLIRMYGHLLHLLRGEDLDAHRTALQDLLEQFSGQLSKVELMNVYGYLQNHYTHQLLKGDPLAYRHLFEVYQRLEHFGLIFGRGEFSGHLIRNVTVVACRLGELEWTHQFLDQYRLPIERELGGNAYAYSRAYLAFTQEEYRQALRHLQDVEFGDPFYRTGHQTLLLRIYYELGQWEALAGLSATFRRYLNRSRLLSDTQKDINRSFISVLHQLVKAQETAPAPRILAKIRTRLDDPGGITDRNWLEAKWAELKGSQKTDGV